VAVRLFNSSNIRFRNVHVNGESGCSFCDAEGCDTFLRLTKFPYENAIRDMTSRLEVREREFAVLDIPAAPPAPVPAASAGVKKLEDGFFSIAGGAVDSAGKLYFVDTHQQRIYGWSAKQGLTIERDNPLDPVNLAFDRSGNLLVLSWVGPGSNAYAFRPGSSQELTTVLEPVEGQPRPGAQVILPANWWVNGEFRDQLNLETLEFKTLAQLFQEYVSRPVRKQHVSPDGSMVLPARRVVIQGPPDHRGRHFSDNMDAYGFVAAAPGQRVYVCNSSEDLTYSARVNPDGTLGDLKVFAGRGGESVAAAANGNVYVANGQVFIYSPSGKEIGRIDVPERPLQLLFGGPGNRTLFILTHRTLYALETK
jgi:sugar lactone lactonase YvrE